MVWLGGMIGIIMRDEYMHQNLAHFENIEPHMKQLQDKGVWTIIERETFPEYYPGVLGLRFVLQVKEGKNDVIERIETGWK